MALVAYGASDSESEYSDNEEGESGTVTLLNTNKEERLNGHTNASENTDAQLFNALPRPKTAERKVKVSEEEDEFLLKKEVPTERPPVRITIPSLADFDSDDEDEPKEKKQKVVKKGSGLFAVLPPPKMTPVSTTTFVPNAVKKNTTLKPTQVKKPTQTKPSVKKPDIKPAVIESKKGSDDEDDEDIPMEFDDETWKQVCGRKSKPQKPVVIINPAPEEVVESVVDPAPVAPEPYGGLDNEAFKKLVGTNKRVKNIKLIDLNEEEVKADGDLWMMKALTDPESKPKYVAENPVNDTCKRKHHITYLAEQAKANEQELQNQWSANRYSRMQTQAKYGF